MAEYVIGFLFSILFFYTLLKINNNFSVSSGPKINPIKRSQSYIHSMVYPLLMMRDLHIEKMSRNKKTQSRTHEEKNNIKVIIMDNHAYWIKDNIFYTADMAMDGNVNKETTRIVDTMTMSKVQLDKMLFIVDKLREGNISDSGSTGNK